MRLDLDKSTSSRLVQVKWLLLTLGLEFVSGLVLRLGLGDCLCLLAEYSEENTS